MFLSVVNLRVYKAFVAILAVVAMAGLFFNFSKVAFLKWRYPIKYQSVVEMCAKKYGVEPQLIYGIVAVESRFRADVVSGKNAKGLMQIVDRTGLECAREMGMDLSSLDLYDPEVNIEIGTFYIKKMINKYSDLQLALAAYNGGVSNVNRWLANDELKDGNGGLRVIPFLETREYVQKVMRAYDVYTKIY